MNVREVICWQLQLRIMMMVVLMSTMKMVSTWAVLGSEEVAAPATERMITVKHNTLVMVKIHTGQ